MLIVWLSKLYIRITFHSFVLDPIGSTIRFWVLKPWCAGGVIACQRNLFSEIDCDKSAYSEKDLEKNDKSYKKIYNNMFRLQKNKKEQKPLGGLKWIIF